MRHPDTGNELPVYEYEPDERPRKRKHHWNENHADFVFVEGIPVGKCPSALTNEEAKELLNEGVPWFNPRALGPHPDRVYVVHHGVVYRATSTNAGRSYHGYPELPSELARLPKGLRTRILARAEELGQGEQVLAWFERDVREDGS